MATDSFRRHARACADASIHRGFAAFAAEPAQCAFYARLVEVVRARSGCVRTLAILAHLVPFEAALVRPPETWPGATGHPLRVIDSLAAHLFARYPVPRFLASVWLGGSAERRRWVVAYASGEPFRRVARELRMNRRMEDVFLRTPDHVPFDHAVRRAEILALGGSLALVDAVLATRLAERFEDAERWRVVLGWLARSEASVDLAQVGPLVDFLQANPGVSLKGRTFVSTMRLVQAWHEVLARRRIKLVTWPPSRWRGLVMQVDEVDRYSPAAEWEIVELLDSHALWREGRTMRHCVATYAWACAKGRTTIWSLRRRWCDEAVATPILTIEVRPETSSIVQVRAKANAAASRAELALVQRWAAQEHLYWHSAWR